METTFQQHLMEATGDSVRAMAERLGWDEATLRRQLKGNTSLRMETVVALCRAYGLPFGPSIVVAGFLTAEEVAGMNPRGDLKQFSDLDLARETLRRVTENDSVDSPVLSDEFDPYMTLPRDDAGGAAALASRQATPRRKSS